MGGAWKKLFKSKEAVRVLMLGLDNSGKTTILYRMKLRDYTETIPTVGFNVEKVKFNSLSLTVWDVGGQDKIRPLWRHYFMGTDAIIWVLDGSDRSRLEESRVELHRLLAENELKGAHLLVLANKSDVGSHLELEEITDGLDLGILGRKKPCYVQHTCGLTGDGLSEGLSWLTDQLRGKKT
mmetsp:Transcript_26623/g.29677  ORF Transcript_26623/g.29677 Transcript_26623/m.29677 type:complete len:181 (-) Transcript_26623:1296-1838(-)